MKKITLLSSIIIVLFIFFVVLIIKNDNSNILQNDVLILNEKYLLSNSCDNLVDKVELMICYGEEAEDTRLLLVVAIAQEKEREQIENAFDITEAEMIKYQNEAETYCKNENKNEKDGSVYSMKVSMCVNDIYKKDLKEYLIKHSVENFYIDFPKYPIYSAPMVYHLIDGNKDHVLTVHRVSKGGVEFKDETFKDGKVVDSFSKYGRLHDYFWLASGTVDAPDGAVSMNEFNFELKNGCIGGVSVDVDGRYAGLNTSKCEGDIYDNFSGLYEISKN